MVRKRSEEEGAERENDIVSTSRREPSERKRKGRYESKDEKKEKGELNKRRGNLEGALHALQETHQPCRD